MEKIAIVKGLRVVNLSEVQDASKALNKHRRMTGDNPCVICDAEIARGRKSVHMICGGEYLLSKLSEETYQSDAGDMYWFPIGPECAKLLPAEFVTTAKA